MSFYRIYRPQVFEEIDNIRVREKMLSLLSKPVSELPHAFLFSGSKGTGKTTAARLIAKLFNCEKLSKTKGPCGECTSCVSIAEGHNIDVLEIDAASNRGIDDVRALRDAIALTPMSGKIKVYVIDEVHMLTTEAFNALLKTLEEPPAHAVFILATTDPQKVPATIQSRCVPISFAKASSEELIHALKRIVQKEKMHIDDKALVLVADQADGSFRDAVKALEHLSFEKGTISEDVVRTVLTVSDERSINNFLAALEKKDVEKLLNIIDELGKSGRDMKSFLVTVLQRLEKLLVQSAYHKETGNWTLILLKEAIDRFTKAFSNFRLSPLPQLPIELAIVEYCEDENKDTSITPSHAEVARLAESKRVLASSFVPSRSQTQAPKPASIKKGEQVRDDTKPERVNTAPSLGLLTLEKLAEHWKDFIEALKPYNHSVAGVLHSSRPKMVEGGIVTIEAFYPFHQEKLSEIKTREMLGDVLKKLFGEKVRVEVVLGKK